MDTPLAPSLRQSSQKWPLAQKYTSEPPPGAAGQPVEQAERVLAEDCHPLGSRDRAESLLRSA